MSPFEDTPTSALLRDAAKKLANDYPEFASELRIRASFLEAAAADIRGHESSRRTLLLGLGELTPQPASRGTVGDEP